MIAVLNRVRIARGDNGSLAITGAFGQRAVGLAPVGPGLFRGVDDHGVVAFDPVAGTPPPYIAASIAAVATWRDARASSAERLEHTLVMCSLLAFVPLPCIGT